MNVLQVESLAFPEPMLEQWRDDPYKLTRALRRSSFLQRILEEKIRNRKKLGRRFFGEAFVATQIDPELGWYGSFKWLTSWPVRGGSPYGVEFRAALKEHFPSVLELSSRALALRELLGGKKPVPPDLWLIVNGEHRFIEVKLPGDPIRSTQIAGLALISACLSSKGGVSAWLYNLYPEGGKPDPIPERVQAEYKEFYKICRRRTRS